VSSPQVRVFINYRREDTVSDAQLLYDRFERKFGRENVFLDANIRLGMNWLEEIKSHIGSCRVFLALIGPRWIQIMRDRGREAIVQPAEDYVASEILRALRPNSGISVIPVFIRNRTPLEAGDLPRSQSLRALVRREAAHVRQETLDQDIEFLIARIEEIAREQVTISPDAVSARGDGRRLTQIPAVWRGPAPPPDEAHCEDVLRQMVEEGNLVPFLGSRMSARRADETAGPALPDTRELAAALARRFRITPAPLDLPGAAQQVYATNGGPDLYRELKQILSRDYEPGPVHRFLARFPGKLEELHLEKRYQLIVSTNFDTALERAFDDEAEPYDLAVYMASGPNKGKFVHFPAEGPLRPIDHPNSYTGFPIGLDYELERTVIVKIHGAVDGNDGGYRWKDNYVITEDHYIDYLSKRPIESLVPVQILDKLKESHCLFLGYTVRDWSLRVFLKRVWEGTIDARSWAVVPDPDPLEKDLWAQSKVDLYESDLSDYVGLLGERLSNRAPGSAGP
jgi:hypothetical protein